MERDVENMSFKKISKIFMHHGKLIFKTFSREANQGIIYPLLFTQNVVPVEASKALLLCLRL